ncbi:MAG TPA: ankyrin repeat domain-containing protein [Thermoanaerobaculia bacterium]|nr:ankyrin repeat domain-containing protein [Thermoanaerobaculia bacterium]
MTDTSNQRYEEHLSIPAADSRAVDVASVIRSGDVERLRLLLSESPSMAAARIVDGCGTSRTLLHVVADWPGHFSNGAETVTALVAAGADVNAAVIHANPDGAPETALHWAASSDDLAVLDALVDGGADLEAPGAVFTGGTPMSDAVVFAQWHAARRLLERGARTTVWQAAALGLLDRVTAFCEDSPLWSDEITNAFWNACRGGQQETAAYLFDRGAGLNWIGHDGKTPLEVARESGDKDLVEWLSSQGAKTAEELP